MTGAWIESGTVAWAAAAPAAMPPLIPVEDFARAPQYRDMQLSPDGVCVGYLVLRDEDSGLGILSLDKMKAEVMMWGKKGYTLASKFNAVFGFQWVSPKRVVLYTALGWAGANRDFSYFQYLTGWGRREEETHGRAGISSAADFYPVGVVPDARRDPGRVLVLNLPDTSNPEFRPDVFQMNTEDGTFNLVEKNPGNVSGWGADWDGNIRFGLLTDGVSTQLIYRAAPDEPWSQPVDIGTGAVSVGLAGLDADNRTLYVFKLSPGGRKALYAYDLKEGKFSGPLFQHQKYDVESAIFSPKYRRLLGVRYVTDGPRQYWFEPDFAKLQKEIDAANPGLVNQIASMDWEIRRLLIFSYSARESGFYVLINLDTGKSLPIAKTRPWLKPEEMAETYPVKCQARDGLELNGYLTLPLGRGQKNLPMVTLVHGGPYGVRDVWGFDPLVQFLANRGYAVLQVNYRGSGGYGEEFYHKGRHEVGGAIQDDIADMTQWAVQQGIADPRRLAIMGGSYGGYSTLFALAKTPDLFRCGIAYAAVSDWNSLFKFWQEEHWYSRDSLRFWAVLAGDMKDEEERRRLAAVSPVNLAAQITAPLLIMHGEDDTQVPVDQARAMVTALKKAGHPPETLFLEEVGHWLPANKSGVKFLQRVEAFLAQNLKGN
jgi:dipeptidyl aminopeptidase/acylaminoacyl peptidase